MKRAFLIGIFVVAMVCVAGTGSTPTYEYAMPGAVAGVGGGGPISLQSGSLPIVAAV
jgi:hypothetical protein